MAILTKIDTPAKGSSATFELNKADLNTLVNSFTADTFWQSQANWGKVVLHYQSDIGNQKELVQFDPSQGSPQAEFSLVSNARDLFQIKAIYVVDFDGGKLSIPRSAISTAETEFDVDLSVASGSAFSQTLKDDNIVLSNSDYTAYNNFTTNTNLLHTNYVAGGSFQISSGGKYYFEMVNDQAGTTPSFGSINGIGCSFSSTALPTIFEAGNAFPESGFPYENIYIAANSANRVRDAAIFGAGFSIAEGDVLGFAVDLDNSLAYLNKNGTWYGGSGTSNADISLVTGIPFDTAHTHVHLGVLISHQATLGVGNGGQVSIVQNPANTPAGYTVV
jgi:hypothetical protein